MKRLLFLTALLCMVCSVSLAQPEKVVYLTFDDGPKKDTPELLEVLNELDVPATFFMVGLSVRAFPEYAKMTADAGHAIGCHSMTHSYNRIKESNEYVARDLKRFINEMRTCVDPEFTTDLYRFPGGSTSYTSSTKAFICDQGYAYFDWNAMTGDAQYSFDSDKEMLSYTIRQFKGKDVIILLMHEGKPRTRRILPDIVAHLREQGYEFRALSTSEEERAILKKCSAHMRLPEIEQ